MHLDDIGMTWVLRECGARLKVDVAGFHIENAQADVRGVSRAFHFDGGNFGGIDQTRVVGHTAKPHSGCQRRRCGAQPPRERPPPGGRRPRLPSPAFTVPRKSPTRNSPAGVQPSPRTGRGYSWVVSRVCRGTGHSGPTGLPATLTSCSRRAPHPLATTSYSGRRLPGKRKVRGVAKGGAFTPRA
jgi:hypothetical protein